MDFPMAEVTCGQGMPEVKGDRAGSHTLIKLIPCQQLQLTEEHSWLSELNCLPYRFLKRVGHKFKSCNSAPVPSL